MFVFPLVIRSKVSKLHDGFDYHKFYRFGSASWWVKAQCVCRGVVVHFCSCFNSFVSNTLSYTTTSWNQFLLTEISKMKEPSLYVLKLCLQIFDYCALTIFVLEIILKWIDGFWKFWNNGWNIFDFLVTLMVSTLSISQSIYQSIN